MNDISSGSSALLRCARFPRLLWPLTPAALLAAAALCIVPAVGQADAASTGAADSDTLAEVIVTATRKEERILDVPVSTSVLSGDTLQVLGDAGDDIRQLAFQVPSLQVESSNGRTFPRFYIRGYGNTDYHDFASQPVGLVYDDIVQENAALKGFPIFDQEDVEVLRGPQGTLFGRNSPAGVVKLESARPVIGETSGFFSLSDGTYNSAVLQGVANVPINDTMAFRASVQGQHRDDWVSDPITNNKLDGFNDWAARVQLLIKSSDTFSALLNAHVRNLNGTSTLFRANIIQPGSNTLVPGFEPDQIYTDGPNASQLTTVGANLHLTWQLPDMTLQSITGYESVTRYFSLGDIDAGCGISFPAPPASETNPACFKVFPSGAGPGIIPFSVETSAEMRDHIQLTQEFRVISKSAGPLTGQAGAFIFYENITSADSDYCGPGECFSPSVPLFTLQDSTVNHQKNNAEALFGSLDYKATDQLSTTAGVRFTADHKAFNAYYVDYVPPTNNEPSAPLAASRNANNVSWDVSAVYKLQPDVNLYARIATGFRAPSFGEPTPGLGIQVAPSETNISYETGIKAEFFDHKARLAYDIYYFHVNDQQLTIVGGGSSDVTELISAKDTIGYGSELEFEMHPLSNLTFNFSGSYNFTKIEDPTLAVAAGGAVPPGDVLNPTFQVPGFFGPITYANINGNPLPEAPKWVADASLRYDFPLPTGGKLYVYTDFSYRTTMNIELYLAKEFQVPPLAQAGLRLGYTWHDDKYDVAVFCRNCTNEIRNIYDIDFDNLTGVINDPRIVGAQFRVKF
jgi:iron complex outermembrane recepter protein